MEVNIYILTYNYILFKYVNVYLNQYLNNSFCPQNRYSNQLMKRNEIRFKQLTLNWNWIVKLQICH